MTSTSTSPTLSELADRVERLTGPCSRETDALIAATLRITHGAHPWLAKWAGEIRATGHCVQAFNDSGESCANWIPLEYTASLDAAMTLVPEGALFSVGHIGDDSPDLFQATIMPMGPSRHASASTPALALTAASLRARAASGSSHG